MDAWLSIIRNVLLAGGAILASQGVIQSSEIEGIVGAIILLISVVWKIVERRKRTA